MPSGGFQLPELMSPREAAAWFRRSPSWLRRQRDLVRFPNESAQPLYHVALCRAYVLGVVSGICGAELRRLQLAALSVACGVAVGETGASAEGPACDSRARD